MRRTRTRKTNHLRGAGLTMIQLQRTDPESVKIENEDIVGHKCRGAKGVAISFQQNHEEQGQREEHHRTTEGILFIVGCLVDSLSSSSSGSLLAPVIPEHLP
jgi:hypothetical protein